jgi:Mg2+ and Co2+ transporter CorA
MNVLMPFNSEHPFSFWAVLVFTLIVTIVAVWFFRKKGWV